MSLFKKEEQKKDRYEQKYDIYDNREELTRFEKEINSCGGWMNYCERKGYIRTFTRIAETKNARIPFVDFVVNRDTVSIYNDADEKYRAMCRMAYNRDKNKLLT